MIRADDRTGVTENEVLSMTITKPKHLGKHDGMSYEARSYPRAEWKNHLANKVLRKHPKFSDECSTAGGYSTSMLVQSPSADSTTKSTPDEPVAQDEPTAEADGATSGAGEQSNVDSNELQGSQGSHPSHSNDYAVPITCGMDVIRPPGRKSQILLRQSEHFRERVVINSERIVDSLELQTCALQEKNPISVYSQEDWETP